MAKTGWNRSLGTSKKEQGILTPPAPHKWNCGCLYIGKDLVQMCTVHTDAFRNMVIALQAQAASRKLQQPTTSTAAEELAKQTA